MEQVQMTANDWLTLAVRLAPVYVPLLMLAWWAVIYLWPWGKWQR